MNIDTRIIDGGRLTMVSTARSVVADPELHALAGT
jgi:hypothetical protein